MDEKRKREILESIEPDKMAELSPEETAHLQWLETVVTRADWDAMSTGPCGHLITAYINLCRMLGVSANVACSFLFAMARVGIVANAFSLDKERRAMDSVYEEARKILDKERGKANADGV